MCLEWSPEAHPARVGARISRTLEVNVVGLSRLTVACLGPLQIAAGRGGDPVVVNMSSALGSIGLLADAKHPAADRALPGYVASKAAVNALTLSWARQLARHGIRVNAVSPGLTPTGLNASSPHFRGGQTHQQAAEVPVAVALGLPFDTDKGPCPTRGATGQFLGRDIGGGRLPW